MLLIVAFLFAVNILTVLVGGDVSSVTVVNKTEHLIDVFAEGESYLSIEPDYSIIHTTEPKPSIEVTAQYSAGQPLSGSITRTITLPYSARERTCNCQEGSPECVYVPEGGGSSRWEVLPSDFSDTGSVEGRGTVWIDDQLVAVNVPLVPMASYEDFSINGINWSGSGTSKAYFDDVSVLAYPSLLFFDDFESYTPGTHPSNWIARFSGSSGLVSQAVAYSGSQSFELVSLPTWSRVEARTLPASADSIVFEGFVYIDQASRGAQLGFGKKVSSSTYFTYNTVTFGNDQTIHFTAADTSLQLGPWTSRTWYKVKVKCEFTAARLRS
jgi:hypothetical protein